MVMPPDPAAYLVVVQADLALGFQDAGLDGPAHATEPDQRRQRGVRRRIGEVGLERRRVAHAAPQHLCWPISTSVPGAPTNRSVRLELASGVGMSRMLS